MPWARSLTENVAANLITSAITGAGAGLIGKVNDLLYRRRSRGEAIFRERAFRQTAPLSRLCSTHDLVRDVYASFGYGPDAIPFWDGPQEHFEFPGRELAI